MDADEWARWTDRCRGAREQTAKRGAVPYPGSGHLFADPSSGDYDEEAAVLLKERTLAFLHRVGQTAPRGE